VSIIIKYSVNLVYRISIYLNGFAGGSMYKIPLNKGGLNRTNLSLKLFIFIVPITNPEQTTPKG
jgi:hypothetical protein